MPRITTILQSAYTKILIAAVFAAVGVAAGIYAGFGLTGKVRTQHEIPPELKDERHLSFGVGDLFPLETFTSVDGRQVEIADLLKDRETVVLLASFECGPCKQLLRFWHEKVRQRLRKDVQMIYLFPKSEGGIPPEDVPLLDQSVPLFYDRAYWSTTYLHRLVPTIVGVDNSGFVTHIQFGFDNSIDDELTQRFFVPGR